MLDKNLDLFGKIFNTFKEYNRTTVEKHIKKLKKLDKYLPPTQSFFMVTNSTKQKYDFVSHNFSHILGLDIDNMINLGVPYWFSRFHPEDLPVWIEALEDLMSFTMTNINLEDRDKLTYSWNHRVKTNNGNYINIIDHLTPIYFDAHGKPIIAISHCSVTGEGEKKPIIGSVK